MHISDSFLIISLTEQVNNEKFIIRIQLKNFPNDLFTSFAKLFIFSLTSNPCQIKHEKNSPKYWANKTATYLSAIFDKSEIGNNLRQLKISTRLNVFQLTTIFSFLLSLSPFVPW